MSTKKTKSRKIKSATKLAGEKSGSRREPPLQCLLQTFAAHPDAVVYDFDGAYLYGFIPALALDKLQNAANTAKFRDPHPGISAWIDKAFLPEVARVLRDRDKIQRKFDEAYRGIIGEILAEAIGSGLPQNSESNWWLSCVLRRIADQAPLLHLWQLFHLR